MRLPATVAGLALLLALAGPAVGASATYVAATGDATYACPSHRLIDVCVGGASFDVPTWANQATVAIDDALVDPVSGYYRLLDGAGSTVDASAFCGQAQPTFPPEAATLEVFVGSAPLLGSCPQEVDGGTFGTIQATWG
jgi:hypothetical protein